MGFGFQARQQRKLYFSRFFFCNHFLTRGLRHASLWRMDCPGIVSRRGPVRDGRSVVLVQRNLASTPQGTADNPLNAELPTGWKARLRRACTALVGPGSAQRNHTTTSVDGLAKARVLAYTRTWPAFVLVHANGNDGARGGSSADGRLPTSTVPHPGA